MTLIFKLFYYRNTTLKLDHTQSIFGFVMHKFNKTYFLLSIEIDLANFLYNIKCKNHTSNELVVKG